jgi:hypothetical protein
MATWSGHALDGRSQFHSIALPRERPEAPPPSTERPSLGRLDLADAAALAQVLRRFTTTPEDCWFGLWYGYGLDDMPLTEGGDSVLPSGDPDPDSAGRLPLVRLPNREYVLYRGPVESFVATADSVRERTANLWWPADHAWCVARISCSSERFNQSMGDRRWPELPRVVRQGPRFPCQRCVRFTTFDVKMMTL